MQTLFGSDYDTNKGLLFGFCGLDEVAITPDPGEGKPGYTDCFSTQFDYTNPSEAFDHICGVKNRGIIIFSVQRI